MKPYANTKCIAFLVPDGIGVRNYLFSTLPAYFHETLLLFHQLPEQVVNDVEQIHPGIFTEYRIPSRKYSRGFELIRQILSAAFYYKGARVSDGSKVPYGWPFKSQWPPHKRIRFTMISTLGKLASHLPLLQNWLDRELRKVMRNSKNGATMIRFLQQHKPSVILCTHQRSVEAGYLMEAAKHLQIHTVTVIFSWDNISKSRITFLPDYCLVWSEWMKNEWLRFYPHWQREKIWVTGTPQFDLHFNDALLWSRQAFAQHVSADPEATYLCFSGNEPSFPTDHLYLHDLLFSIQQLNPMRKVQVIVRPSPNDHTGRLKQVCDKFGSLAVWAPPVWVRRGNREWESNYPTIADNPLLANLVHHCAAVAHCGSTMALDFAQRNKPACYIAYNQPGFPRFDLTIGYNQDHFKSMQDLDAVVFIKNIEDWKPLIHRLLSGAEIGGSDRLVWKKKITDDIKDAPARIAVAIKTIGAAPPVKD